MADERASSVAWQRFLGWASVVFRHPRFDESERSYKLTIGERLATAARLCRSDDSNWIDALAKALGSPNNLINWRAVRPFIEWCRSDPDAARTALLHLWDADRRIEERLDRLVATVPGTAFTGAIGTQLNLLSVLLWAVSVTDMPAYRAGVSTVARRMAGLPPSQATSAGSTYAEFVEMVDRLTAAMRDAGTPVRDRLDAQSILWVLAQGPTDSQILGDWPLHEVAELRLARGEELPGQPRKEIRRLQRITDEAESAAAEALLRERFAAGADYSGNASLGFQGGGLGAQVHWHSAHSVWGCIDESSDPPDGRFWNAFGTDDPRQANVSIVCEVNPPRQGVNRQVAGAFAVDPDSGDRFLVHSGRIGGGRAGIGPEGFRAQYAGASAIVDDGPVPFAIVANLDGDDVVGEIARFVHEVGRVKGAAARQGVAARPAVTTGTFLVAAAGPKEPWQAAEDRYREMLASAGTAAIWYSYPLQQRHIDVLDAHPWLYLYVGSPTSAIVRRLHVIAHETRHGSDGLASPWPDVSFEELRGKTAAGEQASEVFKTWVLVDGIEDLDPMPADFLETDRGRPAQPMFLLRGFGLWHDRRPPEATDPPGTDLASLAASCYEDESALQELVGMIREKGQVILEGPPGSGKTYVADLVARYLTGNPLTGPHDHRLEVVQFHQSYGYEDFVQGIRPRTNEDGQLAYQVESGVFMRLAERARSDPGRDYVLVIDEINRGNLSRIFGELLLLLEYRERSVALPYAGDEARFSIPANLYVLGTMNTTDRSLAPIDYALRRRFYFYRLLPTEGGQAPVLARWLGKHVAEEARRQRVLALFLALNAKLRDELGEHFQVGHSYFMHPQIGTPAIEDRIWHRGVEPLLEEYFYNRRDRDAVLGGFRRDRLLPGGGAPAADASDDGA